MWQAVKSKEGNIVNIIDFKTRATLAKMVKSGFVASLPDLALCQYSDTHWFLFPGKVSLENNA